MISWLETWLRRKRGLRDSGRRMELHRIKVFTKIINTIRRLANGVLNIWGSIWRA